MKRVISILIILSLALCTFPVFIPVSAAETSGNYFNVLDYVCVNSSKSNSFDVDGETSIEFDLYELLGYFPVYGFELTFSYVGVQPSISSFMLDNGSTYFVSTSEVTSGLFRVRGDCSGDSASGFEIVFDGPTSTVSIHSFIVYTVSFSDAPISGIMLAGNTQLSFDGVNPSRIFPSYGTSVQIRSDWWRNYDYADIWLHIEALGINSISAVLQETGTGVEYNIPYEINYINTFFDSTTLRDYDVQLRLDFSNFNSISISDAVIRIDIELDWTTSSNLACTVNSFRGFVFTHPIDPTSSWLRIFADRVSSDFGYLFVRIANFDKHVTDAIDSAFNNLGRWISDQTGQLTAKLDQILDSSSLDQSQADFDEALGSFDGSISDNDEYFSSFDDVLNESGSIVSDSLPDSYQYLDANSAWGTILAFCWYPVPGFSEIILVFIGCLMLCNVILVKR